MKSWLTRVVQDCPVLRDAKIRRWGKLPIIPFSGQVDLIVVRFPAWLKRAFPKWIRVCRVVSICVVIVKPHLRTRCGDTRQRASACKGA
jgi:hypothetical protein